MADAVLFVTSKGFGKVVDSAKEAFPPKGRGGKGVKGFNVTDETGDVVCAEHVLTGEKQNVLITTAKGMCLMIAVDDLKPRSRTAGGLRLINLADDDCVVSVLV
jgi:DNA gyrase subunit A